MVRIPVTTELKIEEFAGGKITVAQTMVKNGIFAQRADKTWYTTQRPSLNIADDASDDISDAKGRGVYYWETVGATYYVNDATIYKNSYSSAVTGTGFTGGTERVYFFEVGNYLVILDPENDEGWYIDSATSTAYSKITDTDFTGITLAKGGAVINGRLYVPGTDGTIIGSDLNDPTAYAALNFLDAELEPDDLGGMAEHHQNAVAFGTRTIEFFYDAGNPTGSPLSPRLEISHEVGLANMHTIWSENDILFFVGISRSGEIGVYVMVDFSVRKVSTPDIDSFLTSAVTTDSKKLVGSGHSIGGGLYYVLTVYHLTDGVIDPLTTLVYDAKTGVWPGAWDLMHDGIDEYPLIAWTETGRTRVGEGMLSNGDIVTLGDDFSPQDSKVSGGLFASGLFAPGLFSATGASGTNIRMEVITGQADFGTRNLKFVSSYRAVGTATQNSQDLTISWSDEDNDSYTSGRTLDTSKPRHRLRRGGRFVQRNHKAVYAGSEQYEFEGLEVELEAGTA